MGLPRLNQPFVTGYVDSPVGRVPQVGSDLRFRDRMGAFKARCKIGRMKYFIDPGLYALGSPDADSHVLVTCNYKLTFDWLRSALPGMNAWILVLDTAGINVWCAAGKGSFGTEELVGRIESVNLGSVVAHRQLILPQLGGPGISAHEVRKLSGFKVVYGPIRAEDISEFITDEFKATPEMRLKTFTTWERIVLIPVELVSALRIGFLVILAFLFLSGFGGSNGYWSNVANYGIFAAEAVLCGIVAGTILVPILLPWIPGRAFSTKGFIVGFFAAIIPTAVRSFSVAGFPGFLEILSCLLIVPSISAYLAMNFTGASSFTSLSGVRKEMRWAVPLQIGGAGLGAILWLVTRFAV